MLRIGSTTKRGKPKMPYKTNKIINLAQCKKVIETESIEELKSLMESVLVAYNLRTTNDLQFLIEQLVERGELPVLRLQQLDEYFRAQYAAQTLDNG